MRPGPEFCHRAKVFSFRRGQAIKADSEEFLIQRRKREVRRIPGVLQRDGRLGCRVPRLFGEFLQKVRMTLRGREYVGDGGLFKSHIELRRRLDQGLNGGFFGQWAEFVELYESLCGGAYFRGLDPQLRKSGAHQCDRAIPVECSGAGPQ